MRINKKWQALLEAQAQELQSVPFAVSEEISVEAKENRSWVQSVLQALKNNNITLLEPLLKNKTQWKHCTLESMRRMFSTANSATLPLLVQTYMENNTSLESYEELEQAWIAKYEKDDGEYRESIPSIFKKIQSALVDCCPDKKKIDLFLWGTIAEQIPWESLALYEKIARNNERTPPATQQWFALLAVYGDWESIAQLSFYRKEAPISAIFHIESSSKAPSPRGLESFVHGGTSEMFFKKLCLEQLEKLPDAWIEKLYECCIKFNEPRLYAHLRQKNIIPKNYLLNVHNRGQKESQFYSTKELSYYMEPMHMVSYALACLPSDSPLLELVVKDTQMLEAFVGYQEEPRVLATLPAARLTLFKKLGGDISKQDASGNNVFHYWVKNDVLTRAGWGHMHYSHPDLMNQKNNSGRSPLEMQRAKLQQIDVRKRISKQGAIGKSALDEFNQMLVDWEASRLKRVTGGSVKGSSGVSRRL